MDFVHEIYQRESFQFLIVTTPPINYVGQRVNLIMKETNDTLNNNSKALINKTIILDQENLEEADYLDAQNGIIKINMDSVETNIDCTEYKVMLQITDSTNTTASVLGSGIIRIKDNLLKKV